MLLAKKVSAVPENIKGKLIMSKKKSRIKKPIYTVRNALRPMVKKSEVVSAEAEFYEKHTIAIWVVVIFIIVPGFIFLRGLYIEKKNPTMSPAAIAAQSQFDRLRQKYPEGFRLFEISGEKIKVLRSDNFPGAFQANWSYAKIRNKDGSVIGIYIPDIYYEPGGFDFVTVDVTFPRKQGEAFSLLKSDKCEITIEIVEDTGERILCALSIRNIF